MITYIALVIFGLALLIIAGDLLVRGAVNLATLLKIPPLIVGLTIVAFGTSAPELVVTLQAVASTTFENGNAAIAMGNIIGSNIANVLLVLGLPALIYPFATNLPGLKKDAVAMILATFVFMGFVFTQGMLNVTSGLVFLSFILIYILTLFFRAKKADGNVAVLDEIEEYSDGKGLAWKTPAYLIAGLIGLPLGAKLLVDNGASLAELLNVRKELIGLTIVAIGTSLPEFATVCAAAWRKQADVAVGNVVGSNIFNLMFVGGIAGLVPWQGGTGVSTFSFDSRFIDQPVMLVSSLLLMGLILAGKKITRTLGIVMTLLYVAYIAYIGYFSASALA